MIKRDYPFAVRFPDGEARDLLWGAKFYRSAAERAVVSLVAEQRWIDIHFADRADAVAFQRHAGGVML